MFPYLPDIEYYQEIIETRWAEIEPDIQLIRAEWDCYWDGAPEGIDKTRIKSISFSDRENISRLSVDAAADILTKLSIRDGAPQYLMLARKSPYQNLAGQFPLYAQMEELASDEKNHIILTP